MQHLKSADQILILNDGEMLAKGSYDDLLKLGINLSSYLSSISTNSAPKPIPDMELKRNSSIKTDTNPIQIPSIDTFKIPFSSGSISNLNAILELEKLLPKLDANASDSNKDDTLYMVKMMTKRTNILMY